MGLCPVFTPAASPVCPHDAQGLPVSAPPLIPLFPADVGSSRVCWKMPSRGTRDCPGYSRLHACSRDDRGQPVRFSQRTQEEPTSAGESGLKGGPDISVLVRARPSVLPGGPVHHVGTQGSHQGRKWGKAPSSHAQRERDRERERERD